MNELMTVKIKSSMHDRRDRYAYHISEFVEYTGRLIPNPKWVTSDSFCLTTDDPAFPFRIIQKESIECAWVYSDTHDRVPTTFTVDSNGKSYTIHNTNGKLTCNCTGFSYRRKCSHVEEIRKRIHDT